MNIFLQDPNVKRLPPEEVRLTQVQITPQPNGRQVKVYLELTPFTKRPNLAVSITNRSGKQVGYTSILETMQYKLEFTMHLRQAEAEEELNMDIMVYYQKLPETSQAPKEVSIPDPMVVDRRTTSFRLPQADL